MSDTITMEQLNEILAAFQAGNGRGRKRKGSGFKRARPSPEETSLRRKANDEECYRKFTAAGYKDVRPRENVLTYGKVKPDGTKTGWIGVGRQVRKGEKGIMVGPFSLFHESQTDPITATPAASVGTVGIMEAIKLETAPASPKAEVKAVDKAVKTVKSDWTEWNS